MDQSLHDQCTRILLHRQYCDQTLDNIRNLCKSLDCAQYKPQMVVNKIFLFNQSTVNFKYFFENSVILNLSIYT